VRGQREGGRNDPNIVCTYEKNEKHTYTSSPTPLHLFFFWATCTSKPRYVSNQQENCAGALTDLESSFTETL
jgi:hypothetical protein